jgi:hypothetical protein
MHYIGSEVSATHVRRYKLYMAKNNWREKNSSVMYLTLCVAVMNSPIK